MALPTENSFEDHQIQQGEAVLVCGFDTVAERRVPVLADPSTGALLTNGNGLTDAELRATPVETVETEAGTSATTVVSVTDSGVTVLAANVDRLGGLISNPGPTDVYISFGTSPATTSMHRLVEKGSIPFGRYTGAIYGITASGSQVVAVTEFEA